jgi:uncharacterized protein
VPAVSFDPIGHEERIVSLDVLRGFALLGIMLVNMPYFAMPLGALFQDHGLTEGAGADVAAAWFVRIFGEFKFYSLFSLLFGAGMMVQMDRARRAGRRFAPTYIRRLLILGAFGMLHGIFIWYGDILYVYALFGFGLLLARNLSARNLLLLALGVFVIRLALMPSTHVIQGFLSSMAESGGAAHEGANRLSGYQAMIAARLDPEDPIWIAAETEAYRDGPFADATAIRFVTWATGIPFAIFGYGLHVFSMFLVGAAMIRSRFFEKPRINWQRIAMALGLAVGLALEMASALMDAIANPPSSLPMVSKVLHEIGSVMLCLGYVGAVCVMLRSDIIRAAAAPFAAIGRMALTAYLFESIAATFLMYWWGLGWFGEVSRGIQVVIGLGIYALAVVLATAWLRYFRFGPLEWLWRTLTYWKPQPMLSLRA